MVAGSLWVTVRSASGLRQADWAPGTGLLAGSSDPFCTCQVEGRKDLQFSTPTIFDTTEPVWNHEHTFSDFPPGSALVFTVWDKDVGGSDDHLGKATVKASQFKDGFDGCVVLRETSDVRATLLLRILPVKAVMPMGKLSFFNRRWWSQEVNNDYEAISAPANMKAQEPQTLKVSISNCTGLRSGDWLPGEGANSGYSDPYCTCEIVGKAASRLQTNVVQESNDPVWNFDGTLKDYTPGDTLLFAVFDQDWGKADDFLGASELPAMHFDPVAFEGGILLSDAGPGVRPRLQVRVELSDFSETLGVKTATGLGVRRKLWGTWSKYTNVKVTQDMDNGAPSITGKHLRRELQNVPAKLTQAIARKKREAKLALIDMVWARREQVLVATRDAIKEAIIADPDMCLCLRRWLAKLVNQIWCDVVTEVEIMVEATRVGVAGHSLHDIESLAEVGRAPPFLCHPLGLRGLLLYKFLPYDRSWFGQLKDPIYFVCFVVTLIPALRNFLYALVLFLVTIPGPPDEYQLVQFVMAFKATQFVSGGIVLATAGVWGYYWCVGGGGRHDCAENGPGESAYFGEYYGDLGVVDIVGSSLLVWVAFLLLPFSQQNAGLRKTEAHAEFQYGEDDDLSQCLKTPQWCRFRYEGRGGRLGGLLRYDLTCFLLSLLLFFLLEWGRYHKDPQAFLSQSGSLIHSWKFRETLFVVRVLYGWSALPFFVFNLPILRQILTHTVPTGFNRRGACVAYLLPPVEPLDEEDAVEERATEEGQGRAMSPPAGRAPSPPERKS